MSSTVLASQSRFIVSAPVAGYLPPPYGTFRGTLLGHFRRNGRPPAGLPGAYVTQRWRNGDGTAMGVLTASAFGSDNDAWIRIAPAPARRRYPVIAFACCAMLIGAFALAPVSRILRLERAEQNPMAWFDGQIDAQAAPVLPTEIRRAPQQPVLRTAAGASAPPIVRAVLVGHVDRPPSVAPSKKPARKATAKSGEHRIRRAHPVRPAPQAVASKKKHAVRVRAAAPLKPSAARRSRAKNAWLNDSTMRAIREELARQDAAARPKAAVSRHVPADGASLLNYQVRLTER